VIALAAVVASVSVSSAGLLVGGYDGSGNDPRYDRFANSSEFIGAGLDFSGVGHDPSVEYPSYPYWVTMISPHFFVSAGHWSAASGTVTFYDSNSQTDPHSYKILGGEQIVVAGQATDLFVGILGSAITSEVYYPVLDPSYVEQGQSILVYGLPDRLGTNSFTSSDINPQALTDYSSQGYRYFYTGDAGNAALQKGDSGGPSFVRIGSTLALVGTHSAVDDLTNPTVSYDTSPSFYIDEINAAMEDLASQNGGLGAGEHVTVVPEPSSVVLLGIAAIGIVTYCRRRGRRIA
jgi:hypothetical protein